MRYAMLILATAVLMLVACRESSPSVDELHDLHSLDAVKAAVNRDTSVPRIVLLLSPT